jgi:serine/threonine protein kinase/WD40 repeat protein
MNESGSCKQSPSRLVSLFEAAVELGSPEERVRFLEQECPELSMRRELEALLAAHDAPDILFGQKTVHIKESAVETVGATIGRYKLLQQIGEGGCGVVYMAEQSEPVKRRVALKVIKLGMDTKSVIARFEAERQALALMDHPNIAKVLDGGATEAGRPYFVMELVRGTKITEYCDQANLSTGDRLNLFIKVCQAIQHAHQKGIIHRDIKPSNILVTLHDGVPVPKVIDFGIAKATTDQRLTDKTLFTALEQFIGTPAYMSPEQAEMSGLDIDTRCDIYALGVLLYELLTGSTPFDAKELLASGIDAMRRTIREKEPVRPSTRLSQTLVAANVSSLKSSGSKPTTEEEVRADSRWLLRVRETIALLRGDLDWIVMKCLEKDRTRRYDTANGLAFDLKRHLNNEPVLARPPSTAYRFQKAFRRNKLVFAAGAAVATALIVGLTFSAWQAVRATHAKQEAVAAQAKESVQRQKAEANEAEARLAQANEAALRQLAQKATTRLRQSVYAADMNVADHALAEGNLGRTRELVDRHVPRDGEPDLRGFEWRYLWGLSRGDAKHVWQQPSRIATCITYSPDGKMLFTSDWYENVTVWRTDSLEGGIPSRKIKGGGRRMSIAFSSRGELLAMALTGELILRDAGTWDVRENLGQISEYAGTTPIVFMRDDQWIAAKAENDVVVRKISSNERQIIPGDSPAFGALLAWCPGPNVLAIANETEIQLWDARAQRLHKITGGSDNFLVSLVSSKRGDILVAGRKDGTVELILVAEQKVLRTWKAHASLTYALAFSPDGRILATGGADQLIHMWDVAALSRSSSTLQPLRTLRGHENQVWALAFSPDGRKLASAAKDGMLAEWQTRPEETSGGPTESALEFGAAPPDTQAWKIVTQARSLDGRLVAQKIRGIIELRVAENDQLLSTVPSRYNLASMAISPSNKFLVIGVHNTLIRLFEVATGKEILVLRGHLTAVSALAFTPDERTLASGSTDGTVKLWSVETGQEMISRSFTHGTVADLKFSKDGQTLGVQFTSKSPTIEFVRAPSWAEINAAEAKEKTESKQP